MKNNGKTHYNSNVAQRRKQCWQHNFPFQRKIILKEIYHPDYNAGLKTEGV